MKYFHFMSTFGGYSHSKPHPEPYLPALERGGFNAEGSIVIENPGRGLIAAREAGIRRIRNPPGNPV